MIWDVLLWIIIDTTKKVALDPPKQKIQKLIYIAALK